MLHVHRAERADALAGALAEILAEPLPDPFEAEVVAVPTRGMERWLSQRLAGRLGATRGRGDGVCANVAFPFPASILGGAVARAVGLDPGDDPWTPDQAAWPLLRVVERCIEESWLAVLAEHLARGSDPGDPRRGRRFSAVRRIADTYDTYSIHRPEMVCAWSEGRDVGASGEPLGEDERWQAQLWRQLRAELGQPSPAERLRSACTRLRERPELAGLPARFALFGLTRLPRSFLDVLDALAAGREVHLFVLHPSPVLWRKVATLGSPGGGKLQRVADPSRGRVANRLLASWGQDSRELQLVLAAGGAREHHHATAHRAGTLLARIQRAIVEDARAPGPPAPGAAEERAPLDPGDRSIQVHACHGRGRQVEVLRDAILHLLEEDPTLEPRDVIVMCPDVETYAPLIQATFAAGEAREEEEVDEGLLPGPRPPDLRVRLADRSLRETNPLFGVVSSLLEMPRSRVSASEVLDLADQEPVRRRFGFDDDDLGRIRSWVASSNIRWGLDAAHRRDFRLEAVSEGTWQAGLDRLLLGVAMADERRLFGERLPLDDVGSGEIELAGGLSEFVERLRTVLDSFDGRRSPAAWREALEHAAAALTRTPERLGWQRAQLEEVLEELLGSAARREGPDLALAEVRALLAGRLVGRPTRANFRTGHLTVCTLVPMRSVPHRVVCLMGLDDGAFPRGAVHNGDDLTLAEPRVGDRDPRVEDRQMLLDALLAAGEHLVITYTGADLRSNARRPPAVPLGELLDEIDATVRLPGTEARARDQVLVAHPLHAFDPRNFESGRLRPGRWGHDATALAGARALRSERAGPPPFLAGPLPPPAEDLLSLANLIAFAERPVRTFLRRRLGVYLDEGAELPLDALPVELDPLAAYGVGQQLLEGLLAGESIEACEAAERARGALPPGDLGQAVLERLRPRVCGLAREAAALAGGAPGGSLEVKLRLAPAGRVLAGTVPGVHGDLVRSVTYAKPRARHRIASWLRLVALSASRPEVPWRAATIARSGDRIAVRTIAPLAGTPGRRAEIALALLSGYVELFDHGMREPLPIGCEAGLAYAEARRAGRDPEAATVNVWDSGFIKKENHEPDHVFAFGGEIPCRDLLRIEPAGDETGASWFPAEPSRLGRYALRFWDELLERER